MRQGRQFDCDRVTGADFATSEHDAHDAGLADQIAAGVLVERRVHQTLAEMIELDAGVAQPRDLDDRAGPEFQARAARQRQEVDA